MAELNFQDPNTQAGTSLLASNVYLTYLSFSSSIAAFVINYVTKANVAWTAGVFAAIVSIYVGVVTIKEKRLNMKRIQQEIDNNQREHPIK